MNTTYPYILAVIAGLLILFLPDMNPVPFMLGVVYFSVGSVFGFLWPKGSWRWGLWIAGPICFLLGTSVLFAGFLEVFLKKDLPILLVSLISTCLGSLLFSLVRNSRKKQVAK